MTNQALATQPAGELRADGTFVTSRVELPNGWQETHRVGKLKIRGEREPRTINYNDYAKLLTFYNAQERLIKDRKHIMVTLSDGLVVNTADITSLEQADEQSWTPKVAQVPDELRELPTAELLLRKDGSVIATSATRGEIAKIEDKEYLVAKCHYRQGADGTKLYLTKINQIPEAILYRKQEDADYPPAIAQHFKYGIPQL